MTWSTAAGSTPSSPEMVDLSPARREFHDDVVAGLCQPRKALSPKWLYDARGSALFEEITDLDEYYPTRTELAILKARAREIAEFVFKGAVLVEYGSGASVKVRLLLNALDQPAAYVPIEISRDMLNQAVETMARDYPGLSIFPICADYTRPLDLDLPPELTKAPRLGFFPGSTIGNFTPEEAEDFLREVAHTLGRNALLLIGVDLRKDVGVLERAYDDATGITAAFNLNLLERMRGELAAEIPPRAFRHRALWNDAESRIEMHLVAQGAQTIRIGEREFVFADGETIHTESSYKYSIEGFRELAGRAGFVPEESWTDRNELFSVHLLRVGG